MAVFVPVVVLEDLMAAAAGPPVAAAAAACRPLTSRLATEFAILAKVADISVNQAVTRPANAAPLPKVGKGREASFWAPSAVCVEMTPIAAFIAGTLAVPVVPVPVSSAWSFVLEALKADRVPQN